MQRNTNRTVDSLAAAKIRLSEDQEALEKVRGLLRKADERRLREPEDIRKWNKVIENLENSLALIKARHGASEAEVERIERELESMGADVAQFTAAPVPGSADGEKPADQWTDTMRTVEGLNLEQACQLQKDIDDGEIRDKQLEAGLALVNQMGSGEDTPTSGTSENRRQLVLRAAIDKISKRQFDMMSLDEIKLVMACHSLLTSRLEPTSRDQRLRRILDGAIKILQRRKDEMEGR